MVKGGTIVTWPLAQKCQCSHCELDAREQEKVLEREVQRGAALADTYISGL